MRSNHRHRQVRKLLLNLRHQFQTTAIGQAQIGHAETESLPLEQHSRHAQILRLLTAYAQRQQRQLDQLADIRFIINNQSAIGIHESRPLCKFNELPRVQGQGDSVGILTGIPRARRGRQSGINSRTQYENNSRPRHRAHIATARGWPRTAHAPDTAPGPCHRCVW